MYFETQTSPTLPEVVFLSEEYDRLLDLICASPRPTPGIALLWQELQRAEQVTAAEAPQDVVRLGSRVRFTDLRSGRRHMAQLVVPERASASRGRISVTTPSGAALIGLRSGDSFAWRFTHEDSGALRIDAVAQDPRRERRRAHARAAAWRARVRELLSAR